MRRLNLEGYGDGPKGIKTVPVSAPRLYECTVRGKSLVIDANSLLAAEVIEDRYPAPCDFQPQYNGNQKGFVRQVVFNVTHGCPLRCSYCFVRNYNPDHEFPTMPLRVARRALNFFPFNPKSDRNPPMRISFFGGEPLVAWRRLQEIVATVEMLAAQRGCGAQFHVTTNGVLLNPDKARWLSEHKFSFIVSLDGDAKDHDKYRVFPDGSGSHAAVLKGLKNLKGLDGVKGITLRGTFTGEGVDLVDRLEYLNGLCDEGLADGVSVEPVNLTEDGCAALVEGHGLAITEDNVGQFREQYDNAAEWVVRRIKNGNKAGFRQMEHMVRRLAVQQFACTECGAGVGIVTVNADGNVFACHREGPTKIGDVWDGLREADRCKWMENRFYARDGCSDCDLRWVCGGGCREYSLVGGYPLTKPHPVECAIKKMWIENALWILSELEPDEVKRFIGIKTEGCCP
ncbi:MAG: SPASM domain-containing protein [Deltaproteobacteria bacterium]|nr:SPASM domain-containing protein [Deltaproteobacteria bacterium]